MCIKKGDFMVKAAVAMFVVSVCSIVCAQQTIVLPAVSDNVHGVNGSIWATEVQIIKMDPDDEVTVRRLWVCLEGGGFAEDPGDALTWDVTGRILQLFGADLLVGTDASLGAVGLVVEGGEVITNARVADVSNGTTWGGTPFGQGQLIPTEGEALVGPAHIPWLGGCLNSPCNVVPRERWNYYRNNIGFVNPNPEPLIVSGVVTAFGNNVSIESGDDYSGPSVELTVTGNSPPDLPGPPEAFSKVVPPFGWTQFSWRSEARYGTGYWLVGRLANVGFLIGLTPDSDLPYYAYASVVFAPDSESGIPPFNDPLFIPARPGFVVPFDWE